MVPMMPIGTPTQKIAFQCHSERKPPMSRPRNDPATAATMLTPSAMPRWFDGNASVRIAVLITGILVFVGGGFAGDLLGFLGLGPAVADAWNLARWPGALVAAMLAFSFVYYITPDVEQRSWRWVTPGAVVGVLLWLLASWGFSAYISNVADVGAIYGAFAGAIILVAWIWLTNVALLFGAELNAEIERHKELREGVPPDATLNRPERQG